MAALKVYRTPIGFHDAYVAASSQKAALKAWGSDADLFARGIAEVITDPRLTAQALACPGEVIRRLRGTAEEQIAAAAPSAKKPRAKGAAKRAPGPRPGRDAIDGAEAALTKAEEAHRVADRALQAEEDALNERRRTLRADWLAERGRLDAARIDAERNYAAALKEWQNG
ncbi:hypothetical protein [Sphingomonas sp.]|uniref:hypothetical protein n=1 Tax=Sphingomonas sp. TaxID=28214 RepID=UPI003CC541C3